MLKSKLVLFAVLCVISVTLFSYSSELFDWLKTLEDRSKNSPLPTLLLLIFLKTISAPLGLPGIPLTLLTGSLFGSVLGTFIALIGNTLGALLAFLLARYLLFDYVRDNLLPRHKKIEQYFIKLEKNPFTTIIALRLIPLFPFNALNFLLGTAKVSIRNYTLASCIGMIPGTFLFVYFGGSLRAFSLINILLAILGIVLLTILGKWYEKRF